MLIAQKSRIRETSTTTGTGTVTLAGAVTGYRTFASALTNGDKTYYAIFDGVLWETGIGTYTTSTLSRDTVLGSSFGGSKIPFAAGTKTVICTLPGEVPPFKLIATPEVTFGTGITEYKWSSFPAGTQFILICAYGAIMGLVQIGTGDVPLSQASGYLTAAKSDTSINWSSSAGFGTFCDQTPPLIPPMGIVRLVRLNAAGTKWTANSQMYDGSAPRWLACAGSNIVTLSGELDCVVTSAAPSTPNGSVRLFYGG